MSKVVLMRCPEYDERMVFEKTKKAVNLLGGIEKLIAKDEKILLKPNLLTRANPSDAVTTHPCVFGAAAKLLTEAGYKNISYGDSPGHGSMSAAAAASEIEMTAKKYNIPAADFSDGKETAFENGVAAKKFVIANGVLECDAIINLCKMKTHMLERITGAQKNLFGCVFGLNKGASHVKYPNAIEFAKMIADLNNLLKPRLHIMDGIVAMDGNGPQGGNPFPMKTLLVSTDAIALDSVFCALVKLNPALVPTNTMGQKYGAGNYEWKNIEVITEDGIFSPEEISEKFGSSEFDVYRGAADRGIIKQLKFLKPIIQKRPTVNSDLCIGCGVCVGACPVDGKAINFHGGKVPVYDYKKCIRCYCCQEMCPQHAISAKRAFISKIGDIKIKFNI